jgi:hypothetical protein
MPLTIYLMQHDFIKQGCEIDGFINQTRIDCRLYLPQEESGPSPYGDGGGPFCIGGLAQCIVEEPRAHLDLPITVSRINRPHQTMCARDAVFDGDGLLDICIRVISGPSDGISKREGRSRVTGVVYAGIIRIAAPEAAQIAIDFLQGRL